MYSSFSNQPDYPAALSSLQHMTSDQLKEILNNEDEFDKFIAELPQMKALTNEKEMLLASNKSLAEYNLSQEPVIREAKGALLEKYQEAAKLGEEVKALKADLDSKTGNLNPDTLLALLEAANQEAEEESEKLMEDFIADGGNVEDFLEDYHEKRKLAHLRRIKIEKMKELLHARKTGTGPVRAAPPPPGRVGPGHQYAPPYPQAHQSPGLPYPSLPSYMIPSPATPSYR